MGTFFKEFKVVQDDYNKLWLPLYQIYCIKQVRYEVCKKF